MKQTLRKDELLRKSAEIERVMVSRHVLDGPLVTIRFVPAARRRVGFVISRKFENAVQRNRTKRVLREIYRCNKDAFPEGLEMILFAKASCQRASFADIRDAVLTLAHRIQDARYKMQDAGCRMRNDG